jgi:hypothetical protein
MTLSATIGYGMAFSKEEVIKAGFVTLDDLADAIADELVYMTRISNGVETAEEETLVMAISNTVITSFDFSQTIPALKGANPTFVRQIDRFLAQHFPEKDSGIVVSAMARKN